MYIVPEKKNELKVRVPRDARLARFFMRPAGRILVASVALMGISSLVVFTYYYAKYSRLIEHKLRAGPFANTSKIFAAPLSVAVGDQISAAEIIAGLRHSGYAESRGNAMGWYHPKPDEVSIFPGPSSYFGQEAAVIKFSGNKISQIVSLEDNTQRNQYQLEPQLITNLFDRNREKRRLVHFDDIPTVLVQAVVSAEDKRFFQHSGFDPFRILKAAYVDLKERRKEQGASTLSQQLARGLWLEPDKRWTRKAAEMMITMQLEQKLSKKEIFEDYANQIYLGRRGSFSIHGFGEASQAYFGKDIRQLTLPEAAMLAGLIQRPGYFNPFRNPERMLERRNVVLSLMRQNGYITDREYAVAIESPLTLSRGNAESADAPYFVDLVNEELQTRFQDRDFQTNSYRVYTTLDLNLQRAAVEAVRIGMQEVDEQLRKQRLPKKRKGKVAVVDAVIKDPGPEPQVALVALDPHTGEIKAIAGGRNYGVSQLNHVIAKRQPGSVFKPFVYAAALNTAIQGGPTTLTPISTVMDEPTTFWFDNKPYQPGNFHKAFYGEVTLRQAIAKSMNIATVKIAEMVGYNTVVDLAKKAGLNPNIYATPAVALGAYEVTPLEMAGAYTIYANQGVYVKPNFITLVRAQNGSRIYSHKPETHPVLDRRVAYLMVSLLEEVMRSGTAAGVRSRGFKVPAAGKTGTSHDGWFAGFTSELLCIVWVGYDDNRELNLEGAKSALPIWTEFMKRAVQHREYRNAKAFQAPDGIVSVEVDPLSGQPASPTCPSTRVEVFIAGTEPLGICQLHAGGDLAMTNVAGWDHAIGPPAVTAHPEPPSGAVRQVPATSTQASASPATVEEQSREQQTQKPKEKKGLFRRLWGVFK